MRNIFLSFIINTISKLSDSNKLTVLTYHRVGESYNQLFMDEHLFEQQLIWLKKYFNPVDLAEGIKLQQLGTLPEMAIAISIDDGYVDSYTKILPLLKKHKLTATFFISTSGIEAGYLWDERVSSSILMLDTDISELTLLGKYYNLSTYNKRKKCVMAIANIIKYSPLEERNRLVTQLLTEVDVPQLPHQFLSDSQIKALYQEGMGIGAHTINHPILCSETLGVVEDELLKSKQRLEGIIDAPVDFLAYPNGKKNVDFNEDHQNIAKKCGYQGAFSTDWGCIGSSSDCFAYTRFTPWDITEVKFSLRLALNFNKYYKRLMIK